MCGSAAKNVDGDNFEDEEDISHRGMPHNVDPMSASTDHTRTDTVATHHGSTLDGLPLSLDELFH